MGKFFQIPIVAWFITLFVMMGGTFWLNEVGFKSVNEALVSFMVLMVTSAITLIVFATKMKKEEIKRMEAKIDSKADSCEIHEKLNRLERLVHEKAPKSDVAEMKETLTRIDERIYQLWALKNLEDKN